MKLNDLLEGAVVDFQAARAHKSHTSLTDKLRKVIDVDLPQHYEYERQAMDELHHFEEWMNNLKQKSRVPGFENIDEVSYYLVIDLNLPSWTPRQPSENIKPGQGGYEAHVGEVKNQQKKIRQWYSNLKDQDKKKFGMIVHHTPRMRKALEAIRAELYKFIHKWADMYKKKMFHTQLDAQGATSYLDTETSSDLKDLQHIEDIAHIIGLV